MKQSVLKDVTFCDVCMKESYVTPCLKCGKEYCFNCREGRAVEYRQGVHYSSVDGLYCKPCDIELCETKADPLHQAYLAIKLLRDDHEAYYNDFGQRTEVAESNLKELLALKGA